MNAGEGIVASFIAAIAIVDGVIPIIQMSLVSLGFSLGPKTAEAAANAISSEVSIFAQSVIPWWLDPVSIILVIIFGIGIFIFINRG